MKKIIIILLMYTVLSKAVVVIGHRGASGYEPENTLVSFEYAVKCGADMVELDVWRCASGELVVFHDIKVDRVTDGHGYVTSKTLSELKELKIFGREDIPTLSEVFDCVNRRTKVYIELKGSSIANDVLLLIEHYVKNKHWQYDDFLIASFDHIQLQNIKSANDKIPLGVLVYGIPVDLISFATSINAKVICLDSDFLNQHLINDIQCHNILVYVYTINDKNEIKQFINWGVDGIITDFPDQIPTDFST